MKTPISISLAIGVGVVVLAGYFIPTGLLQNLRQILVEWAGILAAVALIVGISNLYYVHWNKMNAGEAGSFYSFILVLSLTATLILVGWFGPVHSISLWIFNYLQVPIESSLMALLAVILVYITIRMIRRRIDSLSVLFIITAVFILVATSPLLSNMPAIGELRTWVSQVPAVAGARGILIGVVLGIVATGLRIMMGADRPYGGQDG